LLAVEALFTTVTAESISAIATRRLYGAAIAVR